MEKFLLLAALGYLLWGRKTAIAEVGEIQMISWDPNMPIEFQLPNPVVVADATASGCGVFTPSWSCGR